MSDRSVTPHITADQAARVTPGPGTIVHRRPLTVVVSADGDVEGTARGITGAVDSLIEAGDLSFGPVAAGLQQFVVDHQPTGVAAVLDVAPDAIAFLFDQAVAIGDNTTHRASGRSGWTTVFIEGDAVSLVAGPGPERPVDPWSQLWAGTVAGQGVQVDLRRAPISDQTDEPVDESAGSVASDEQIPPPPVEELAMVDSPAPAVDAPAPALASAETWTTDQATDLAPHPLDQADDTRVADTDIADTDIADTEIDEPVASTDPINDVDSSTVNDSTEADTDTGDEVTAVNAVDEEPVEHDLVGEDAVDEHPVVDDAFDGDEAVDASSDPEADSEPEPVIALDHDPDPDPGHDPIDLSSSAIPTWAWPPPQPDSSASEPVETMAVANLATDSVPAHSTPNGVDAAVPPPQPIEAEPIAGPPPMPEGFPQPSPSAEPITGPPPMPMDAVPSPPPIGPPPEGAPIAGPPPMPGPTADPTTLPPPPPDATPIAGPPPMPDAGSRRAESDEPD